MEAGATLPSCIWPETPGLTERCGSEHCYSVTAPSSFRYRRPFFLSSLPRSRYCWRGYKFFADHTLNIEEDNNHHFHFRFANSCLLWTSGLQNASHSEPWHFFPGSYSNVHISLAVMSSSINSSFFHTRSISYLAMVSWLFLWSSVNNLGLTWHTLSVWEFLCDAMRTGFRNTKRFYYHMNTQSMINILKNHEHGRHFYHFYWLTVIQSRCPPSLLPDYFVTPSTTWKLEYNRDQCIRKFLESFSGYQ